MIAINESSRHYGRRKVVASRFKCNNSSERLKILASRVANSSHTRHVISHLSRNLKILIPRGKSNLVTVVVITDTETQSPFSLPVVLKCLVPNDSVLLLTLVLYFCQKPATILTVT